MNDGMEDGVAVEGSGTAKEGIAMRRASRAMMAALAGVLATGAASVSFSAAPHRHSASDRSRKTQTGVASFYGHREAGRTTASGAALDPNRLTAASPTLPLGTRAKVTNPQSGKSTNVTITDRGPYAKGRVLDVTPKAAEQLGMTKDAGVAKVEVKPISEPAAPHR